MMNKDLNPEETAAEELSKIFDFKAQLISGKMPGMIRNEIHTELFKEEKSIIFRLEEMKDIVDGVLQELNDLDFKYKEIQTIVDFESTQFNKLSRDIEVIDNQRKMMETRITNQKNLQDTLNILLSGLQLSEEEYNILKSPKFSSVDDLRKAEDAIEKVGKFLKFQVDKFKNMKLYQDQVDIMDQQLTVFTSLLKEDLVKVAKKSALVAGQGTDAQEENGESTLYGIDLSGYKQALMQRRRVIKSLISAKNNSSKFIQSITFSVKEGAKLVVEKGCKLFEKAIKSQFEKSPLIKQKCGFNRKLGVPSSSIIQVESEQQLNSLMNLFMGLLIQVDANIELDLNYWSKFFTFDSKKYTKDDREIIEFVLEVYSPLFQIIKKIVEDCSLLSPISAYCFSRKEGFDEDEEESEVSEKKSRFSSTSSSASSKTSSKSKEDTESQSIKNENTSKDESNGIMDQILEDLRLSISKAKSSAIKDYTASLADSNYSVKYSLPFEQSQSFADNFRLMIDLFGNHIKNNFDKDLSLYASKYLDWIEKESKKEEKYTNLRIVQNLQVIITKLTGSNVTPHKYCFKKIEAAYKENQSDYCIYLFCYNFSKFSEMWFKIKEINPSDWESESPYKASKFVQAIENTFSHIDKEVEPIIKRMKKHFCKDQETIQKQFEALSDFILEQYQEIEKLCMKVLKIKVTPSLAEVKQNLEKKKSQLQN